MSSVKAYTRKRKLDNTSGGGGSPFFSQKQCCCGTREVPSFLLNGSPPPFFGLVVEGQLPGEIVDGVEWCCTEFLKLSDFSYLTGRNSLKHSVPKCLCQIFYKVWHIVVMYFHFVIHSLKTIATDCLLYRPEESDKLMLVNVWRALNCEVSSSGF
jgi:hypothetical protein